MPRGKKITSLGQGKITGPANKRMPEPRGAQPFDPEKIIFTPAINPPHLKIRRTPDGRYEAAVLRVFSPESRLENQQGNGIADTPKKAIEMAQASALLRAMQKKKAQVEHQSLLHMFKMTRPNLNQPFD